MTSIKIPGTMILKSPEFNGFEIQKIKNLNIYLLIIIV